MRTLLILLQVLILTLVSPAIAKSGNGADSLLALQREVVQLFNNNKANFHGFGENDVTVGFLINAKNELIIQDVTGDSPEACEFVKQVLNYQKVKYSHARQLTRYSITIHLMKNH